MKVEKIHFYHYHSMPPIFEKKYPKIFRKTSMKLEKPDNWKGYFLSSAFVVEASKTQNESNSKFIEMNGLLIQLEVILGGKYHDLTKTKIKTTTLCLV